MTQLDWRALLHKGLVEMKLRPDEFWQLTPAEFALMAGIAGAQAPLSRQKLTELMQLFPDSSVEEIWHG